MAAGDLITTDWQFEYNGLLMGDSTSYDIVSVEGLDALPVRAADDKRPIDHGAFDTTQDFLPARIVEIQINVLTDAGTDAFTGRDAIRDAFPTGRDDLLPLVFQLDDGEKYFLNCRCRRRALDLESPVTYGDAVIDLMLWAPDPRIYSLTPGQTDLVLATISGGLDFDLDFDIQFGTATSNGGTAVNNGNIETRPVVSFLGPLTSPRVSNLTQGKTWKSDIVLGGGETMVVDFLERMATVDGANRNNTIEYDSEWFNLEPGSNSLQFSAGAGSGSASVEYHSAWDSAL